MGRPAEELGATTIAATLDAPLESGKGLLFCSTFQLAWNSLRELVGGPLALEGDPPLAAQLESSAVSKDDVDADSCLAVAGEGPGFLEAVRAELQARFGEGDFGLPEHVGGGDLLAYAYLAKDLDFASPFAVQRAAGLVFDGVLLQAFGVWPSHETEKWAARASQVTVHDYRSHDDFVIELETKSDGDRLILARIAPSPTLGVTASRALARVREKPSVFRRLTGAARLSSDDVLKVPLIRVDVLRKYHEVAPRPLKSHLGWTLSAAFQGVRFELDEKGAVLRSSASIVVLRGGVPAKRQFILDAPFLVLLLRQGRAIPYFAMWVANPELLVKAEPP